MAEPVKRMVHTLVFEVRLPDGTKRSWSSRVTEGRKTDPDELGERKKEARAKLKARAKAEGAVILKTKWTPKTKWRVLIPQPDGSYKERVLKTHGEAKDWAKAQDRAQSAGLDLDRSKEPLSSVVARWRDATSVLREWEAATAAHVDSFLNAHILPAFGDWPVGLIRRSDVEQWTAGMIRGGLKKTTAGRVCSTLERILQVSVQDGAIAKNPCSGIDLGKPEGPSRAGLWLERPAVHTVAVAMPERYQVALLAAHGAALRFQEMAGLRRDRILAPGEGRAQGKVVSLVDVDSSWRIKIDSVLTEVKGHLDEKNYPKTEAGLREVPIPTWLAEALLAHCDRFGVGPSDLVFTTPSRTPLRRGNFSKKVLYPVSEKVLADLRDSGEIEVGERVHTHDLRRSGISQWIADGIRPEVAQVWAGHSDLRTTMKIYHSVFPSTNAEAAARLEEANSGVNLDLGWSRFGPGAMEGGSDEEALAL